MYPTAHSLLHSPLPLGATTAGLTLGNTTFEKHTTPHTPRSEKGRARQMVMINDVPKLPPTGFLGAGKLSLLKPYV